MIVALSAPVCWAEYMTETTEPAGNRESSDHRKVIATCPEMFGLAS